MNEEQQQRLAQVVKHIQARRWIADGALSTVQVSGWVV